MIPYGKHFLNENDIEAVVDVLRSGYLTQGEKISEFEKIISDYTGSKYAIAVSSGTAALHLACMAANLGEGDVVLTSTNTFVASANCALYVGASPDFVDIDPINLNLDIGELDRRCSAKSAKAIIPVHFAGLPCDMHSIKEIANKNNSIIIEDASHALGACYSDESKVGNCKYSDMTVFSFHPVKGVTSGEGGIITTNNKNYQQRLKQLRSHGICKGNFDIPGIGIHDNKLKKPDIAIENGELKSWYYEMHELGFNYRITDIQSALAISQMKKIDDFLDRRRELAESYDEAFKSIKFIEPTQYSCRYESSNHLYVIKVEFKEIGMSRHNLMKKLAKKGIGTQVHYIPLPMHPFYENLGFRYEDYPATKEYYESALTIPLYYELTDKEQVYIVNTITEYVE